MTKEITIVVNCEIECTEDQFKEWVEFELGYMGGCSQSNPLCGEPLEALEVNII